MSRRKTTEFAAPDGRVVGRLTELGGLLFSSGISGVDSGSGPLSGQASAQVETAFTNLARILERAGAKADQVGLVTVCLTDGAHARYIDEPWGNLFADETNLPVRKVNEYPLPEGELVQIQVVGALGAIRRPIWVAGASGRQMLGARVGGLVFSAPIDGTDPATGRRSDDRKTQMRQAFDNLEAFMSAAGGSKDDLIHVLIFVPGRDEQADMLEAWLEAFPVDGDRPARKAIFDPAVARESKMIQLMCVAAPGRGRRINLEVPGISKRHPNPMGCKIGNFVFSSGVGGDDPSGRTSGQDAGTRAVLALENMRSLIAGAGGGLGDIGLVSITVNDYADEDAIVQQWRKIFPDPADEPARHIMAFGGRGTYPVQLHMMAVLDEE